jgi:hypothetical protein
MNDNFSFNEKPYNDNEDNCGGFIDHHPASTLSSDGYDPFSISEQHPKVSCRRFKILLSASHAL